MQHFFLRSLDTYTEKLEIKDREGERMAEFRGIKMSLFLLLALQFTDVGNAQFSPNVFVRRGDEVTLSCEDVRNDQDKCDGTTWVFHNSRTSSAVELVNLGKIQENAASKSHRLSVTENCSLVIKKVTAEDVGRYTCRQVDKSEQQQGPDSLVYLSVVTMTEHRDTDKVMLSCSVSTYERCGHKVKWLLDSKDTIRDHIGISRISVSSCNVSLHLMNYHHIYTSRYKLLSCEVTEENNRQRFTFPLQPSPEKSGEDNKTSTTQSTLTINLTRTTKNSLKAGATVTTATTTIHGASPEQTDFPYLLRCILVSVGLAALIITVVAVNVWTRSKGNKTQTGGNTVRDDEDEDDGTVTYENDGAPSASVRRH